MNAGDDTSASNDDAVRDLVRDFLQLKVQVGDIASAKCITILFVDEDVKKSMQAAAEKWTSTKPTYVEGAKREPHPLGCAKKVYTFQQLLVCLFEIVCKHSALKDVAYAQNRDRSDGHVGKGAHERPRCCNWLIQAQVQLSDEWPGLGVDTYADRFDRV